MSESHAFFGTVAMGAVNAGKLGLQLAVLPIMARLLGPSAFGLIAVAMPFILMANLLCDGGMGAALARHRKPSLELESTVFWLSLAISVALAALLVAASVPLAKAIGEPGLAPVMAALTVVLVISGALAVPNARIWRARNFGVFAACEFAAALASAAVGVGMAVAGWGAWSLVGQQVSLWAVKGVWLIVASGLRPRLYCRPSLVRPFAAFSVNGVGAGLADLAGKTLPAAIAGVLLGVTAGGHYAMAYQLTRIPELVLSGPLYLATFAAIAKAEDRAAVVALALKGLRLVLMIGAPAFVGLALIAEIGTTLLLGAKWTAAAPLITLLAPGAFLLCVYAYSSAVLMGAGRSDRTLALTLLLALAAIAGAAIGTRWGANGVAIGFSLATAVALPFYVLTLSAQLHLSVRQVAAAVSRPLLATLGMGAVVWILRQETAGLAAPLRVALLIGAGAASYAAFLMLFCGRQVAHDLKALIPLQPSPRGGLS
jgi:PST family polysaccharide transporter